MSAILTLCDLARDEAGGYGAGAQSWAVVQANARTEYAALQAQVAALAGALERLLTAHEHGMSPLAILQVMQEARTALRAAGRAA